MAGPPEKTRLVTMRLTSWLWLVQLLTVLIWRCSWLLPSNGVRQYRHNMMLSILLARQACENDATHEADRGSDAGDCTDPDGMRFAWAEEEPELPFEVDHLIDQ